MENLSTEDRLYKLEIHLKALEQQEQENKKLLSDLGMYISNAKLGLKFLVGSGWAISYILRVAIAIVTFVGLYEAVKEGKIPSISGLFGGNGGDN